LPVADIERLFLSGTKSKAASGRIAAA